MTTNDTDFEQRLMAMHALQAQLMDQLAVGQHQLNGLARRVWRVQEDERKKIALDLHDGLGQILTALINQMQQLNDDQRLDSSLVLARQALADTRSLSRLLRPRMLDDLGLTAALRYLVRSIRESTQLGIEDEVIVSGSLPEEMQTLLYRLVQEALTNVVKHANASLVQLKMWEANGAVNVLIEDNGRGFSPLSCVGFGLSGMQDRVAAFSGRWELTSAPGSGCRIAISIPT